MIAAPTSIPLPPLELRALVSRPDPDDFARVADLDLLDRYDPTIWRSVLDFGCGPGRHARVLLEHDPQPRRYVGVDLDRRGLEWCAEHLHPLAQRAGLRWDFVHLDIRHPEFNPTGTADILPLPMLDRSVSLLLAHSVFTHLIERDALRYLHEAGRVLTVDGLLYATWFLLDKSDWPQMRTSNALYADPDDPTTAVIYDRAWLAETARAAGLVAVQVVPPDIRGGHWRVVLARPEAGRRSADWPPLDAVAG